jgi:phosphoglycolate phosphatase-like HAD superfamily hydrolase
MKLQKYLIKNPKKVLIFDFDETLFKLHLDWEIFREGIRKLTGEYDQKLVEVYNKGGMRGIDLMNMGIKKFGDEYYNRLIKWCIEFETKYLEKVTENPQLKKFIKNESDKYELYIWSGNQKAVIKPILEKNNLDKLFEKLITREKYKLAKPHIDGFKLIFDPKKHSKKDFLMIGDSSSDKEASEKAGIDYFEVTYFK